MDVIVTSGPHQTGFLRRNGTLVARVDVSPGTLSVDLMAELTDAEQDHLVAMVNCLRGLVEE